MSRVPGSAHLHLILAAVAALLVLALPASRVSAQESEPTPASPFDRPFALASYATGHAGSYEAVGIGGRARWEALSWLGVEAYLEATVVSWDGGFRHDWPNGFNLFVPIRIGAFRVRPYLGFCDVLSFAEPPEQGAPRADDVLFGAHAGVGAEWGFHHSWSAFIDLQANAYAGHDRTARGWTGSVGEELEIFAYGQINLGVQLHVGSR